MIYLYFLKIIFFIDCPNSVKVTTLLLTDINFVNFSSGIRS